MAQGKYTVNEVEERTKVPGSTLRQWERRYGFPKPERSDAGYRLYSDADLGHIDAMKRHIAEGIPASRAAELVREVSPGSQAGRPLPRLQEELVAAFGGLDEESAGRLLSEAYALHPLESVVMELLAGSLQRLGELWQQRAVESPVVTAAASFVEGRLRSLFDQTPQPRGWQPLIVAAAPRNRHAVSSLILALLLRRSGHRVHYLGADVQLEDLAVLARRIRPGALLLSASGLESLEALEQGRSHLIGVAPLVGLGGAAFNRFPEAAVAVGGTYLGSDIPSGLERLQSFRAGGEEE